MYMYFHDDASLISQPLIIKHLNILIPLRITQVQYLATLRIHVHEVLFNEVYAVV